MKQKKGKSPHSLFSRIILFANYLAVALLLLSYLAPLIDPRSFWPLAFLGLAYPVLLVINILFILYWLFGRPKLALISLITIIAGFNSLTSTFGFRSGDAAGSPKTSEKQLRIMTYNVHFFRKFEEQLNDQLIQGQMFEVIRNEQPDVICFQEYMTRTSGVFNTLKTLKKMLGTPHVYFERIKWNDYESQGLAIFSKFPITNTGSLVFPNTERGNEAIFADIKYQGRMIRLYNVHFQSIGFQPEDYQYLKDVIDIKKADDVGSSRRIGGRLKRAFIRRSEQAEILKAHTLKCKTPFLLSGDFNDTPVSYAVNTMQKGLQNTFREQGSGLGITYNGDFPNFQIDYIFASSGFAVKSYCIPKKKLSDHYAVRSDVELTP